MKRFLWGFTALCLMCFLSIPALAAGTPNWDGPLGKEAGPHLCKTGKDDVLYYDASGAVYRSADGVAWTELNRQWAEESVPYSTGLNGLAKKEFEILWTGSEYMMRQSLLDDPRTTTHQQYGDSPRNNMVTFLDEDFRIIGVRAFDAPVTAIGCENGGYSAEVNGEKVTFSPGGLGPGRRGRELLQRRYLVPGGRDGHTCGGDPLSDLGTAWKRWSIQPGGLYRRTLMDTDGDENDAGYDAPEGDRGRGSGLLLPIYRGDLVLRKGGRAVPGGLRHGVADRRSGLQFRGGRGLTLGRLYIPLDRRRIPYAAVGHRTGRYDGLWGR